MKSGKFGCLFLILVLTTVVLGLSGAYPKVYSFLEEGLVASIAITLGGALIFLIQWIYRVRVKDYSTETNTVILKRQAERSFFSRDYLKAEQISKRALEFNWQDVEICSLYLKSASFNRLFTEMDSMYFDVLVDDFYSHGIDGRRERISHILLYGLFLHQIGEVELAQDYKDEAVELNPNIQSKHPEYFNKF
jgi:hypothetical protein